MLRAGFIEAPVSGPKTIADIATQPPIATAANSPTARESVATAEITNIKMNVNANSMMNKVVVSTVSADCVKPRVALGSFTTIDKVKAPAMHPKHCATM